ncbi:MAG: sortase domain-containing protein [Marmoricola sp.]
MTLTQEPPADPTEAARRRSPWFWIGVAMIVAGLALLAWLAWLFFGTTYLAHRDQRQAVQSFERGERLSDVEAVVRIPRLGADYAVPVYEGVTDDVLARGLGHFPGTAGPGQRGNYALAGHRVTHGEPLRHLPDLRPGDRVLVETHTERYVYVLDTDPNDLVVPFTAGWVLERHPTNPGDGPQPPADQDRLITLATCSEIFHTDDRMIAFGHLVRTRHLAAPSPRPLP